MTAGATGTDNPYRDAWIARARCGDFEGAWALTDRMRAQQSRAAANGHAHAQVARVSSLRDRRVLVQCTGTVSDTIQFIRYVPMLRSIAREVIVGASPALFPLLRSVVGVDRLLPLSDGQPQVVCDVSIELTELPYLFRTTLTSIPRHVPYIRAPRIRVPGSSPSVGIAIEADSQHPERSLPQFFVETWLNVAGVSWFSLQRAPRALDGREEEPEEYPRIRPLDAGTILATASSIQEMDLVIAVDGVVAHLAGALGIPTWTLLSADADWRWMCERADTPWYPTMELFRQVQAEQWENLVVRVRTRLERMVAEQAGIGPSEPSSAHRRMQ